MKKAYVFKYRNNSDQTSEVIGFIEDGRNTTIFATQAGNVVSINGGNFNKQREATKEEESQAKAHLLKWGFTENEFTQEQIEYNRPGKADESVLDY